MLKFRGLLLCIIPMIVFAESGEGSSVQNFLVTIVYKYPVLSMLIAIIGSARAILKPIFSIAHSIAQITVSDKDNKIITKIENSKILKTILYISDYVFSIKALNPNKMAEYRHKKLK